ncbi:hypothetical protein [Leifsonia sp. Root4]|uniref:hypothetical protein n=1 Tax=Leifsonia sp. Root4 TaxID=1736525 RepID=UPI000A423C01|nr:hypothetical protein [Leifsonia sp. Root4]
MKTIRTRLAVPVAIVAALLLAPALSACSSVSGIVNGAVEDASGGNVSVGALPSGWPDEVPVIEGDVVGGGKNPDGAGWIAIIKSEATDPIADAQTQLEAAGFSTPEGVSAENIPGLEGLANGAYFAQNANYAVVVAGSDQGVLYTVVPITQ